jgi:hypothetical protein
VVIKKEDPLLGILAVSFAIMAVSDTAALFCDYLEYFGTIGKVSMLAVPSGDQANGCVSTYSAMHLFCCDRLWVFGI